MAAIPDFWAEAAAMENWGLITFKDTALLYDSNLPSVNNQYMVAVSICHELSHQWFGNLVTMKWWTDLWLNEGFATYMGALGVHHIFPEWNTLQLAVIQNFLDVSSSDALKNSHPISATAENSAEISRRFDAITYQKGFNIIWMMGVFLGKATLEKGVGNYLKKYQYNNAEQDDLWQSLTEQAHSDGVLSKELTVKAVMDTWTLQTGYPVVTIQRNYGDYSAEISQVGSLKVTKPLLPISYRRDSSAILRKCRKVNHVGGCL